ncbi:MAG: VOC family protein [Pseudonocardiaceae bacterium]
MFEDGSFIPGSACWIDVSTTDPAGSREFYASLFGWTYRIDPDSHSGQYATALLYDLPVAGLAGTAVPRGRPARWRLYLNSANVSHTAMVIQKSSGQLLNGPTDAPGGGSMVVGMDPTGGEIGFWQPATTWIFHTVEPGSLVWADLNTQDGQRADEFFATLFGYRQQQIGDVTEMDYTVWSLGDYTLLGRFTIDKDEYSDTPAYWMIYFAVDPETGTDDTVNRVIELGGQVNVYPFDSTFGRTAVVQDPSGAVFSLIDTAQRPRSVTGMAINHDPYDN